MSPAARILVFAAVLAAVFGAALGVGRAVGPLERGSAEQAAGAHAGEAATASAEPADGLAVAVDGLRLVPEQRTLEASTPSAFAFRVVAEDGTPVEAYDLLHDREMHLVVVRRDLTGFQHLHPTRRADGAWTTTITLAEPGAYRAFADFSTAGRRAVLGVDLAAAGSWSPRPLPGVEATATTGPYTVELETAVLRAGRPQILTFTVGRDGVAVTPDPYLGARGHLVILREGDLGYLHTHPEESSAGGNATAPVEFETTFPSPGRYRAFLQFGHGGRVHTAAFTVEAGT